MTSESRSGWLTYAVALFAVSAATGLRAMLDPWLGDQFPFATLFVAVLVVAWYGGFGPALAATAAGALLSAFFLLPPRGSVAIGGVQSQAGLVLFAVVGLAIAALGGAMRSARLRVERLLAARNVAEEDARRSKRELELSERRYRQIVEDAHIGIWQLDAEGRTRFANRRMATMLACTLESLLASHVDDFLDAAGREQIRALRQRRRDGISEHVQLRFNRRDGSELWALLSASPVHDDHGGYDGVIGMLSDITDWKRAEGENVRLYEALQDADRRKDEFLALLGHELRNPLAPISNALHVLKLRGADPAIMERARDMMERQVGHMVRLVDDLLDVSRIMRGKVELKCEPVELATVIARAVETVQPMIDADGHQLVLSIAPEPLWVNGDIVRLAQIVSNLLNNAAKYSDRGSRIELIASREGSQAVMRVRDNGIGIAPALIGRIFEMFFQAERRTRDSHGGLGMGLSLVRSLTELHGGTVEAFSEGPGRGSEFVVRLPFAAPDECDGSVVAASSERALAR